MGTVQPSPKQAIEKLALKNVFAHVSRVDAKPEVNADQIIRKCRELLKTDTNYKQQDFDLDFIRYKVLRFTPEKKAEPQPKNESPESFLFNDGGFISDFDSPTVSDCDFDNNKKRLNFDDLSMMYFSQDFATQESFSSFSNDSL